MITVKILSYKSPQRFAVKNTLLAAHSELQKACPNLDMQIVEVKELAEIETYTQAIILPSLVINEKLVCIGRFPKKQEAMLWLKEALSSEVRQA